MTPDMLDRAWRMGYLAGCNDPSMERIVRANLSVVAASQEPAGTADASATAANGPYLARPEEQR